MPRSYQFEYPKGREVVQILCWNGGQPFLVDARYDIPVIWSVGDYNTKAEVLAWASEKKYRCVGFEGDTRLPRRSGHIRTNTWAVVG